MTRLAILLALLAAAYPHDATAQSGGGADRSVRIIDKAAPSKEPASTPPSSAARPMAAPQLSNAAGLSFDLMPGEDIRIGSRMLFRVSAKRGGYVLVFDVDATGRTSQIFPNVFSRVEEKSDENRIAAGAPVAIPEPGSRRYEFVASPPAGVGMVVVVHSDTPLQVIDLPDVPTDLLGRPEAAEFVRSATAGLRFISADGAVSAKQPDLSFAARYYVLR